MKAKTDAARAPNQSAKAQAHLSTKDYYNRHGYFIAPNLVPATLIDELLNHYHQKIVPSKEPFFRQTTNKYEINTMTDHGYVAQSFLDIHGYSKSPKFSSAALEILFSAPIINMLSKLTGSSSHNLMNSVLFDVNAETVPHKDCWYLDTIPSGNLTAAWIALEDIDERAGRFFVMTETMQEDFLKGEKDLSHSAWLQRIKVYFDEHQDKVIAPALKKGDIIFWNSKTIHGALPTQDRRFSRKSLTAHYIPSQFKFGNLFAVKDFIEYRDYKGHKYYCNQPEYSRRNKMKYAFKTAVYDSPGLLRFFRKFQRWGIGINKIG
ncbi:MAG: phytanoyl-CoA dioxygenase family protein [Nitrococcus sp.]|nr:phytanoyl-CoA dioxygenase family protein [Nitrococcus sp.]